MHIPICKTTGLTTLSKYLDCQILQLTLAKNQVILLGQKFYFPFLSLLQELLGVTNIYFLTLLFLSFLKVVLKSRLFRVKNKENQSCDIKYLRNK